jgi:hypothetical protein
MTISTISGARIRRRARKKTLAFMAARGLASSAR